MVAHSLKKENKELVNKVNLLKTKLSHSPASFICQLYDKGWVAYRFSYAMHHNDANNIPPSPYYMPHFQIFDKTDSFLKNVSDALDCKKKAGSIFEESHNLHIIVG